MNISIRFKKLILSACWLLMAVGLHAQHSMGVTGLLNIPTADMQADGTFMAGGNYLPEQMLPEHWDYNSGNYFLNMTFLPCLEIGYRCTLLKLKTGKWNQDRSVSLRIRPLKEGKYWPSVVVGSNDALTTGQLNTFSEVTGNRYFSSVYGVATKHFLPGGHDLAFTFGWNIPFRKHAVRDGVFGGMSYSPAFCRPLSLMAEYDGNAVNMGGSVRLFNHFTVHVFCYDLEAVSCGVRGTNWCYWVRKGADHEAEVLDDESPAVVGDGCGCTGAAFAKSSAYGQVGGGSGRAGVVVAGYGGSEGGTDRFGLHCRLRG